MEEVLRIKGDGGPGHGDVLVQSAAVADVGPHGEGHCFSLQDGVEREQVNLCEAMESRKFWLNEFPALATERGSIIFQANSGIWVQHN